MKKELMIFFGIMIILALGMHFKEWTTHPIEHLMSLPKSGAYGLGALHPFIFTLVVYGIVALFRGLIKAFRK
jgi:hypothetical protein